MLRIADINPGDNLPTREFECSNVQQFLYNAALWNAHRIHFDQAYATTKEGYPGLVVAGPLMGDWLTQCVLEWIGEDAQMISFEYSNRKAAFTGDVLRSLGKVLAVEPQNGIVRLELQIRNMADEVIAPGEAVVLFPVG
jgi:hydroxyacyl-ACP dehydratase HTD2-like protein with hotdog domain